MTTLKTMIMAGATLAVLAAPAVSMAQTWDRDHGYRYDRDRDGWRDRDDGWRRGEWRAYDRYEDRRYDWRDARRCWTEDRGFYNWYGRYEHRAVEVCR
jgi:hypothetical protein